MKQTKAKNIKHPKGKHWCIPCHKYLPISEFFAEVKNPDPNNTRHFKYRCKTHERERRRQRWAKGWRPKLASTLWNRCFGNAKKHRAGKLKFTINVADIRRILDSQTQNGVLYCAATGGRLKSKYCDHPLAPSVDRIDNKQGYLPDNIRIVARTYNLARNCWNDSVVISSLKQLLQAQRSYSRRNEGSANPHRNHESGHA